MLAAPAAIGLDVDRLEADIKDPATRAAIDRNRALPGLPGSQDRRVPSPGISSCAALPVRARCNISSNGHGSGSDILAGREPMLQISNIGLMTAFAAGIVSFLSPCVLPLVPS
ncbi:hypothetical protein [Chelatococcus albus]|uniref:hypothetical protein n=1 Tax=Chelatococcus albus TaxID=3047466 RepID=UPI003BEF33E3